MKSMKNSIIECSGGLKVPFRNDMLLQSLLNFVPVPSTLDSGSTASSQIIFGMHLDLRATCGGSLMNKRNSVCLVLQDFTGLPSIFHFPAVPN